MSDETRTGRCFCGAVRYRLQGAPMFVHCCHCRDCQQQTGSAFVVNGLIEADRVEVIEGQPISISMPTESGYPHHIFRCQACQSPLWSDYGGRGWLLFVRLATLDDPGAFTPDVHIFTRSKLPWVVLPEGAKAFEEYYDPRKERSPESRARYKAAKEKAGASR